MKKNKIFLSGGMTDVSYEEAGKWRRYLKDSFNQMNDYIIFNPNEQYNFKTEQKFKNEFEKYLYEKEARELDLTHLRNSDLVIVNFNSLRSIGTAQELAIANELKIPIIGVIQKDHVDLLHPWLKFCCLKLFVYEYDDFYSCLDNIVEFVMLNYE